MTRKIEQFEIGMMLFESCATFIRKYLDIDVDKDIDQKVLKDCLRIDDVLLKCYINKKFNSRVTLKTLEQSNEEMKKLKDNHNLIKQRLSLQ